MDIVNLFLLIELVLQHRPDDGVVPLRYETPGLFLAEKSLPVK